MLVHHNDLKKHNVTHKIFSTLMLKYKQTMRYISVTTNLQTVVTNYTATGPESSFSIHHCLIGNGLLQARTELDHALLQLIHIIHWLLPVEAIHSSKCCCCIDWELFCF